jgi:hypothetical protein
MLNPHNSQQLILDQSINMLWHRRTTRPFVFTLICAQAVTHRHAAHIIAAPDSASSQAVAITEWIGPQHSPHTSASLSAQTKTFIVRYPITAYVDVSVDHPSDISKEDLLSGISRDELVLGVSENDGAWDSLKSAWRDAATCEIYDEEYEEELFI